MSILKEIKDDQLFSNHCMIETFNCAEEVALVCDKRNTRFGGDQRKRHDESFTGVKDFEEARDLLATGYQPTVDKFKCKSNSTLKGITKRITFGNDIVGHSPIVPLALLNVPTCMNNQKMKPIKAKVIDIYYDMTANCGVSPEDILKAGEKMLETIMKLEMEGYRFNLYATQNYSDGRDVDMLCVKIKDDRSPVNLKRMSFPLTHPAYFRCIGFDWYTRNPKSINQSGFGRSMFYDKSEQKINEFFKRNFGPNVIPFSCSKILKEDTEYIEKIIIGGNNNV